MNQILTLYDISERTAERIIVLLGLQGVQLARWSME